MSSNNLRILFLQHQLLTINNGKIYLLCKIVAVELIKPCSDLELCLNIAEKSFCPCFLRTFSATVPQQSPPHMAPVRINISFKQKKKRDNRL